MELLLGKINSFNDNTLLFEAGDNVEYIAYIKKGSVIKSNESKTFSVEEGNFICYDDLYSGFYYFDYTVSAGSEIIPIPATSALDIITFLHTNKAVHKSISFPLCSLCKGLYEMYGKIFDIIDKFYTSIKKTYDTYIKICKAGGSSVESFALPHDASRFALSGQAFGKNLLILGSLSGDSDKEKTLSASSGDKYYKLQIEVIDRVYYALDDMFHYLKSLVDSYTGNNDNCLFSLVAQLNNSDEAQNLLLSMKDIIYAVDSRVKDELSYDLDIDLNRVNYYFMVDEQVEPDMASDEGSSEDSSKLAEEFKDVDINNILLQLCNYAGLKKEHFDMLNKMVIQFMNMSDKYSKETDARTFRKKLAEVYYQLYEAVFLKYAASNTPNVIVKLFLDYGLLDERLLSKDHIYKLMSIAPLNEDKRCGVYRMSDWLLRVYRGDDIPSKTEFDQEYTDFVRERKKNEALSAAEERRLLEDNKEKVHYEIQNMLKYNSRLLNGNLLTFYPMLHSESFEKSIDSMLLTTEIVLNAVDTWKEYDYSVFYRELMYSNEAQGIEKEVIQKEIYPIFVLFPVVGVNGVMWQDISGKRSNSSGRFFLPAFFNGNLSDTMLTLLARFRWELCKTMQGVAWNNIQVPSLTSEFIDYIQFYKKNKELSAEKKEAIKNQLAKCHNNMRDFFVYDYTVWLKYEAAGAMRLNKFARRILATYCPMALKYREKQAAQPIFEDAMKRFNISRLKKIKEYQTRINYYQGKGKIVPDELVVTKEYYDL